MANIMSSALRSLFPKGSAWRLLGNLGLLVEGIGDSLERARTFLRGALAEARPGSSVVLLPEWHAALGHAYDATQPVDYLQRTLKAIHTSRGGVGLNDLNAQIHKELTDVNITEIAYNGPSALCGEAECGLDECNSLLPGSDANPTAYFITGTVQNDQEEARVASVIGHFAPLHLQPMSLLVNISENGNDECGSGKAGIAECNYAP